MSLPRLHVQTVLGTIALVTTCALGACDLKNEDKRAGCVNVGGGWRACSDEMAAGTGGEPAMSSGAAAPQLPPDPGPRAGNPATSGGSVAQVAGTPAAGAAGGTRAGDAGTSGAAAGTAGVTLSSPGSAGAAARGGAGSAGTMGEAGAQAGSGVAGRAVGGAGAGSAPATAGAAGGADNAGRGALPELCCHSLGVCAAVDSLTDKQRALLVRDTCQSDTALCAPTAALDSKTFVPRACHSVLQAEGRCLPDCLSDVALQAKRLPRDVCDPHEVCMPCFDPSTAHATGSCNLGADPGPRELPQVFSPCCNAEGNTPGLCVPQSYLPAGISMPRAECGTDLFCAPRSMVSDPTLRPSECTAEIRGAGVCLPQCIAEANGPLLTVQASCSAGERCYPCQLVDGTPTRACPAP